MSFADFVKQVEALEHKEAPETEPYKWKYEARDLLSEKRKEITLKMNDETEMKAMTEAEKATLVNEFNIVKFHLGINYITTEERSQGAPLLKEVVAHFRVTKETRIKNCLMLLQSLNYLAIVMSGLSEAQKSKKHLDQAEQLYNEAIKSKNSNDELFNSNKDYLEQFEREFTQTLFYFAQIYLAIGNNEKSAQYSQKTLQRQLRERDALDRRDWTRNALGLSQYHIYSHKYRQGVHCIEAACKIAPEFKKDDEDDEQMKADIEKGWGLLYSELLKNSFEVMSGEEMRKNEEKDKKKDAAAGGADTAAAGAAAGAAGTTKQAESEEKSEEAKEAKEAKDSKDIKHVTSGTQERIQHIQKTDKLIDFESKLKCDNSIELFTNIRMKTPPEMTLASTYEEAKELFVPGLKHLMAALKFYVLDGFVTDHVKIAQDVSKLYKYLAFFEKDPSTKCKMHKRRINLLQDIESQLAPHAYPDIVQELCHELGVIHDEMAGIKKEMLRLAKEFDVKQAVKINALYSKAIAYFTKFVQIYEYPPDRPMSVGNEAEANAQDSEKKKKAAKIDPECRHEYLEGHFMLAAIYSKLMYGDKGQQINAVSKSLSGYQHVVKFYDEVGGVQGFELQYQIAKEMAELLPFKINQMQNSST